ncbi:cytidine deaminase [Hoylesella buccalis]|jgi:cytidine deaminase|uniref:cytidine deaminase n=1 Tax=Hoylesella buccalis TaxID=28127 RepID=UPI001D069CB0|nr:cytidine deaminase [Hoylesella buccalis]MCB6902181.1 cytidine deaminase [Hoylesella buccalis]UEA62725.1 cytidine deaminase [Hoylesella buccalis]UWP49989.1 cytidine deaminase [Hoylesella buccalis ATCC 35310]
MEQIDINISIESYQLGELSPQDQELVQAAIEATKNAYANYSRFYVGAALRLENGKIVIGANQENAAFPSGLCAERTAVFAAQANYPDSPIETLAIAGRNEKGVLPSPITPCGACRQVILEIEDRYKKPIKILLYGTQKIYCVRSVKDLLPLSFVDDNMR